MSKTIISPATVKHIAALAHIPISDTEERELADGFSETLVVVDQLQTIDVSAVEPTHQVTGLENVWREDVVKPEYSFSQAEALQNAAKQHNGFFVVPRLIDQD